MKKSGFAIILVLATLVLLAMLAYIYIKLALIDRNIARNYMDNKRAKLIAQSGVDYALARLQQANFFSDEDWQTFTKKDALGNPVLIKMNGIDKQYSESTGSTYGKDRDIFILKISDSNSRINVNDGLNNERVKLNTARILDELGIVVNIDQSKLKDPLNGLGRNIIDSRPTSGYSNVQELKSIVKGDESEFKKFKDYVTTVAWQDKDVANPVPLSQAVISAYDPVRYNTNISGKDIYRYGRGKSYNGGSVW